MLSSVKRYVIGIDFGTLSGRAVLVDVATGRELAAAVHDYRDGVIETALPGTRQKLPHHFALQNPADYLEVLRTTIPAVLRLAKVDPRQVVALGTDFTSCTVLPVKADGTPLCREARWKRNPHAWVKLWKHHAAQPEASFINEMGARRGEEFVQAYGGRYSSEWFFSKVLQTARRAPEVYDAAERFIEAGDWIVWQLCGEEKRCLSAAGFKAMRVHRDKEDPNRRTFPNSSFFKSLHPKMEHVVRDKIGELFYPLGSKAGGLTPRMAKITGLLPGTPVAVGNIDAHAAVPACTVTEPGKLVMIMGTSTCHLLLARTKVYAEGICGVVEDGVSPGLWGYEAGQAAVGDLFAWYVNECVPTYIKEEAQHKELSVHDLLARQASRTKPGESGLLALDWWNGSRSVLMDADLSGLLLGATLATKPHEIYRALIEATAFGTRKIIEAFTARGIAIDELYACGGLAHRNPFLLQIYADVTGRPIKVAAAEQASALGAAMQATVAAGIYPDIHAAASKMARVLKKVYRPSDASKPVYDRLYAEYVRLHDFFGREASSSMKILKQLKCHG